MILKPNHIIDDVECVKERLMEFLQQKVHLEEIQNFILTQPNTVFYFKRDLSKTDENDKNVRLAWIDTGYCYKSEPVFFSLLKDGTKYVGHYVGTASFLVKGLIERYGNKKMYLSKLKTFLQKYKEKTLHKRTVPNLMIEEKPLLETEVEPDMCVGTEIEKKLLELGYKISAEAKAENQTVNVVQTQISPITEEIYGQLLYSNWQRKEGLDRYIKVIGCRIKQLVKQGKKEYFVINNIGSVVINTGLLDRFCTDCYILYRYYKKYDTYIPEMLIRSKVDYTDNGFTKEDANMAVDLKPIQFTDAPIYFEATLNDFDINQRCVQHIIEKRRDRFPESIRKESENILFKKIQESLEQGLKIQMHDHSYAKLIYSGKDGELSWLLPLHIQRDFTNEPELVLAIRKKKEYYELKTILPYDDELKDKITAMALYGKLW